MFSPIHIGQSFPEGSSAQTMVWLQVDFLILCFMLMVALCARVSHFTLCPHLIHMFCRLGWGKVVNSTFDLISLAVPTMWWDCLYVRTFYFSYVIFASECLVIVKLQALLISLVLWLIIGSFSSHVNPSYLWIYVYTYLFYYLFTWF